MSNARENLYPTLTHTDYDIAGNVFRAYYDADKKLVMVLDFVINDTKPNVLLVTNPVGNRKWDDILMNDYAVDLETIRPKKDNKYQKLDIEYTGLAQYDDLIRAYENDTDLSDALAQINKFRNMAAQRAATERLNAANASSERARETIEKTNEIIKIQRTRLKDLQSKLTKQRRDIGREPTKQSAAKILRTESQIEATNDKLARAKKRLTRAQHRLYTATEDADIARTILAHQDEIVNKNDLPTSVAPTEIIKYSTPSVPTVPAHQFTQVMTLHEPEFNEPKAENMAKDKKVKPLFDKDPEILDEEIAFKPIDFNLPTEDTAQETPDITPSALPEPNESVETPESALPAQEEFEEPDQTPELITPAQEEFEEPDQTQELITPAQLKSAEPVETSQWNPPVQSEPTPSPVLNSLTPIESQSQQTPPETPAARIPSPLPQDFVAPIPEPVSFESDSDTSELLPSQTQSSSMPEISPAPIDSGARPVSPINNKAHDISHHTRHKPTMLYYLLLVILIALSIFTLWIYQKSTNDLTPELGIQTQPVTTEQTVDQTTPTEPVMANIQPETIHVTPEAPVALAPEVPLVNVPPTPQQTISTIKSPPPGSPFLSDETVEKVPIKSETEILATKPVYNVSQNAKMFVASPEYETDTTTEPTVAEPTITKITVTDTVVTETPDTTTTTTETVVITQEAETCSDGTAPDINGCCSGEQLMDMGDGTLMCCGTETDECFMPITQ